MDSHPFGDILQWGIMPYRRGHSDAVNIDANQMDVSKIDATIYQKHNKRWEVVCPRISSKELSAVLEQACPIVSV